MSYREWKEAFVDGREKSGLTEVNGKPFAKETEYLVRNHVPGADVTAERAVVDKVISSMPPKVQKTLNSGTIIDIGKEGASQYDYVHDILYIAKGADETEVIHEIGHMVENRMIDTGRIGELRKKLVGEPSIWNIKTKIYLDASGNEREIFLLNNDNFVSEYQGRIYVDDILEAFNNDGRFRDETLWEFMSEPFREYIEHPEKLKMKSKELYDFVREVVE